MRGDENRASGVDPLHCDRSRGLDPQLDALPAASNHHDEDLRNDLFRSANSQRDEPTVRNLDGPHEDVSEIRPNDGDGERRRHADDDRLSGASSQE